jgi:hypothetical protein
VIDRNAEVALVLAALVLAGCAVVSLWFLLSAGVLLLGPITAEVIDWRRWRRDRKDDE